MPIRSINNTFNRGELDPTLFARDDIDVYTKGARKLRNMVALWTGAARIAPGSAYTDIIVDRENANAVISDYTQVNAVDFLYDADEEIIYTMVLRKSGTGSAIDIYYDDTLQATVTTTPYTTAQIKDVHFAAAHDRILLLHEDVQIRQLVRGASHSSWTLSSVTTINGPTFDYSVVGQATNYRVAGFTFTLSAVTGTGVTLTASSGVFTANHVGGLFRGNGGLARITAVTNSTTATVTVATGFDFDSTSVQGTLASLTERMWTSGGGSPAGADRGWPSRGVFFLGRLMLGRNATLRNVVAVSTDGVYDDFDDSADDAFASFNISFNGKGEQSIQTIIADDSIIFLTNNKIFAQSPLVEEPLTISNVYFAPQTQSAAAPVEAVTIDNQILFISANRSQVLQLVYDTATAKYLSVPASLLSSQLFEAVNSNSTWEPQGIATRLFLATQDDGTMLMYSTLISQNVAAWSLRTTRGKFRQTIGDGRQAHVIAERQINLGNSTFESALDYAYLSDPTFEAYYDVQSFFESAAGTSDVGVLENQYDYIVMGNDIPFTALNVDLNTNASTDCGLTFEYLDINGFWNALTPTDNTTGLTGDGTITWTFDDVLNWAPNTLNGIEDKYWMRIRRTTETVATTPVVGQIEINTGVRLYLERLSFNQYMDSSIEVTSDNVGAVTGLSHLAGHQVFAIENGATSGPYFVDSSGETTIRNLEATVDIGIQYKPLLVPMPLLTPTQQGDNMYEQKYVQDLYIDYVDSLYLQAGIKPELTDIPNMDLGNYTLGNSVSPQTGIFKMHPRGDWEPRQEVTITQSQPGPMTIIGVGYNVEVT